MTDRTSTDTATVVSRTLSNMIASNCASYVRAYGRLFVLYLITLITSASTLIKPNEIMPFKEAKKHPVGRAGAGEQRLQIAAAVERRRHPGQLLRQDLQQCNRDIPGHLSWLILNQMLITSLWFAE